MLSIQRGLKQIRTNLLDVAREITGHPAYALPMSVNQTHAAHELERVLSDLSAWESGGTVAAMVLLRDRFPSWFRSDRAFAWQVVRMWRARTELSFGSWYDPRTERTRLVYRDLKVAVVGHLSAWLLHAYAPFASRVLRAAQREAARSGELRAAFETIVK